MKPLALLVFTFGFFWFVARANGDEACRYMKMRKTPDAYARGGPFLLDHFRLTKGRTDAREFLWKHWHDRTKGIAQVEAGTVDRGTVKVLYVIQPDATGHWGIDIELDRPMDPPCISFHADSIVRLPIANPAEDYPSQTIGLPDDRIPARRLADTEVADAKRYRILFVRDNKPASSDMI